MADGIAGLEHRDIKEVPDGAEAETSHEYHEEAHPDGAGLHADLKPENVEAAGGIVCEVGWSAGAVHV